MLMLPPAKPQIDRATAIRMTESKGVRLETTPFQIGGMRGYFPQSMGSTPGNDRGVNDDGFFILTATFFETYNGNCDPSRFRAGQGTGAGKGMASLLPGVYPVYQFSTHNGSKRQYPAICQRLGPVNVMRDGPSGPYPDKGMFGINLHEGGDWGTSSLGCQTFPPSQWDDFYADAKREAQAVYGDRWNKTAITYALFDMAVEEARTVGVPTVAPPTPAPSPPTSKGTTIPADIIAAARESQAKWGIPASISLAQWAVESGRGKHMPPGSNNPFGIKARKGDPSVVVRTREVVRGETIYINAPFRKFASLAEAFDEHGKLLATVGAYANARTLLPNVDAFADALTGVYATDPTYGTVLKQIMRGGNFYQYDDASVIKAGEYPTLRRGVKGDAVGFLQVKLGVVGPGDPGYGTYGPKTEAAVRELQGAHGLNVDGVTGQLTWAVVPK
ncbi:MAG TPA: glucosaminidase domain-containing protein [Allosphingosinicella sp.]|nr:glucosaminidase domain-containing protein [Allosphingosinicella sp.]